MSRCGLAPLVDRHFAGVLRPGEEHRLREHLPQCPTCAARYERRLLLSRLDPRALPAEERLARGLGLTIPRWRAATHRLAAACALLLVVGWFGLRALDRGEDQAAYRARGGAGGARLLVYRRGGDGKTELAPVLIRSSDALAFAYQNPRGWSRLYLFARAPSGAVFWYYPAWLDPAQDPGGAPIRAATEPVELPEAVRHALPPGRLTLRAVFTDQQPGVQAVERRLAPGEATLFPPALAEELRLELEVQP